jgi:phage/plasmid-associated DNA primase
MNYEIVEVPNYKINYEKSTKHNLGIADAVELIKENYNLHERLYKDDVLKLFLDVDKIETHDSALMIESITSNIKDYLQDPTLEISYTKNNSSKSYHVVIPKYKMKNELQKLFWEEFKVKYSYNNVIDTGIYYKDQWFRLPHQSTNTKLNFHEVVVGEIQDFILKYTDECVEYKYDKIEKVKIKIKVKKEEEQQSQENEILNKDVIILLDMLDNRRSDEFEDWVKIGMILKNEQLSVGHFHHFSKKSLKYDFETTEKKFKELKNNGTLRMASLHFYARTDNLEKYAMKFLDVDYNLINPIFTSGLLAEYFKSLYNNKFIYKNDALYYFNGVYWVKDSKNTYLNMFVKNEFYNNLLNYVLVQIKINNNNNDDEEGKEEKQKKLNLFMTNISKLKHITQRKVFIEDILIHITDENVVFDAKNYLFGFNNKIFNLDLNDFIEPDPTDYVSITCGYDYNEIIDVKTKKDFLMSEIIKILPNENIRNYFLVCLSTGLSGIQLQKLFIDTGVGGNGKSIMNGLMLACVGTGYGYRLPNTVIMNTAGIKEGANPTVFNLDRKRFVLTSEPCAGKINCSTIKSLTGDLKLNVRDLYSSNCTGINLCMTLFLESNELPLLSESTEAMRRRLGIIPFNSRFLDDDKFEQEKHDENVYKQNPYFASFDFQEENKQILFLILTDYYQQFKNNKYIIQEMPAECLRLTSKYLCASDDVFNWFENVFQESQNKEEETPVLSFKSIYGIFKETDYFDNLSKADKRLYNQKYFYEKLEKNLFLKRFIKKRNEKVNNKQLSSDSIIGWELINENEDINFLTEF